MTNTIKRFREKFGAVNPKYIAGDFEGREFCAMCGSPTKVDKVYKELEAFITAELKAQRKEIIEEIKDIKVGQNVIINCISRADFKESSRLMGYNQAIKDIISHLNNK